MTERSHNLRSNKESRDGRPLPDQVRARLETLFGASLATVRWHEDGQAERIGAVAFARGEAIHFARGVFDGGTSRGLFVLGHEIAHVMQQRAGLCEPDAVLEDPRLEDEANQAGLLVALGLPVPRHHARPKASRYTRTTQCIKLQIDSTAGTIDAAALAAAVDNTIEKAMSAARHAVNSKDIHVTHPQQWLAMAGRLSETGIIVPGCGPRNRPSLLPCRIKVEPHTRWMEVKGVGGTERLYFTPEAVAYAGGRDDLSYPEIADGFQRLARNHPDFGVARDMLLLMMGKRPLRTYSDSEADFLAGMVALMFGLESSRFPSALISSLLILDLIMYRKRHGRGGTPYTLEYAFDSSKKLDFGLKYGGKYPCAVHKPGPGNSSNRRFLGSVGTRPVSNPQRAKHLDMVVNLSHRFVVPRRETTLLISWIEAHCTDPVLQNITIDQIKELLTRRVSAAYFTQDLPSSFPSSPRANTGVHAYAVDGSDRASEASMIGGRQQVYWFPTGMYYHASTFCKILADRTPRYAVKLTQSFQQQSAADTALDGRGDQANWEYTLIADAKKARKQRCLNCMRP